MMMHAERMGLGVSAAGHVLLFGALSLGFLAARPLVLNSPPMEVDLVSEVALTSTTPKPSEVPPPPATAPEIAPPQEPPPVPEPPKPVERTPPPPKPVPAAKPTPKAAPKPPTPAKPIAVRPAPTKPAARQTNRPSALVLSDDIVKGAASERRPKPSPAAPAPTAAMGPQQQRAIDAEISRQIYRWLRLPSGADVEQLVALLDVRLDTNGEVIGTPQVLEIKGITPSNRPQIALYKERAVQAVLQASPFQNLPEEYYEQWKWLRPLRVSARLAR